MLSVDQAFVKLDRGEASALCEDEADVDVDVEELSSASDHDDQNPDSG